MALSFPTTPTDGSTYVLGGITSTYTSASDSWIGITTSGGLSLPTGTVNGQTIHWNGIAWLADTDIARNFISAGTAAPTTRTDGLSLAEGDIYYNTIDDKLYAYNGSVWNVIGSNWTVSGSDIYRNSNVGVGVVTPLAKLDISGSTAQNVAITTGVMDLAISQVFTSSVSGATTFSFINVPASRSVTVVLHVTNPGSFLTWPTTVKWPGGTAPTLSATGLDVLVFHTVDGGTTWRGNIFGKDIR